MTEMETLCPIKTTMGKEVERREKENQNLLQIIYSLGHHFFVTPTYRISLHPSQGSGKSYPIRSSDTSIYVYSRDPRFYII